MSSLTVFEFETRRVRFVGTFECPEWIAQDVCDVLEIRNHRDALADFDEDEKGVASTDTLGGTQEMLTVKEPGFYKLIFRSRKPVAKRFQRWVFHDVLPTIRKTGKYEILQTETDTTPRYLPPLEQADKAMTIVERYKLHFSAMNPQMEQHFKDLVGNCLIDFMALTHRENQKELWMGVVNYAETELGYQVQKKGSHCDTTLGKWVRWYCPQLSDKQEKRFCNETQRQIYVYPIHLTGNELSKSIHEFFACSNPSEQLKSAGAYKRNK